MTSRDITTHPVRGRSQRRDARAGIMVPMTDNPQPPAPPPGFVDIHARLRAREILYGTFLNLASPVATEAAARAGFDWVVIDLEHGDGTEADLLANRYGIGATPTAA